MSNIFEVSCYKINIERANSFYSLQLPVLMYSQLRPRSWQVRRAGLLRFPCTATSTLPRSVSTRISSTEGSSRLRERTLGNCSWMLRSSMSSMLSLGILLQLTNQSHLSHSRSLTLLQLIQFKFLLSFLYQIQSRDTSLKVRLNQISMLPCPTTEI